MSKGSRHVRGVLGLVLLAAYLGAAAWLCNGGAIYDVSLEWHTIWSLGGILTGLVAIHLRRPTTKIQTSGALQA